MLKRTTYVACHMKLHCLTLLGAAAVTAASETVAAKRPHIVAVLADDLGALQVDPLGGLAGLRRDHVALFHSGVHRCVLPGQIRRFLRHGTLQPGLADAQPAQAQQRGHPPGPAL